MSPSARHLRGKRLLYSVTNRDNPLSQLSLRDLKLHKYTKLHKYAKWSGISY